MENHLEKLLCEQIILSQEELKELDQNNELLNPGIEGRKDGVYYHFWFLEKNKDKKLDDALLFYY